MAAAASPKSVALGDGQRFVLQNIGWQGYESLLSIVIAKQGNRP
jgi:hypothetical protein